MAAAVGGRLEPELGPVVDLLVLAPRLDVLLGLDRGVELGDRADPAAERRDVDGQDVALLACRPAVVVVPSGRPGSAAGCPWYRRG